MDIFYRFIPVTRGAVDLEKRTFPVTASTEDIDTYETILDSKTWKLQRFAQRGPVLYSHNPTELPIGFATNVRVEGTELKADITIVSNLANPKADNYLHSVNEGSLQGVSVGFMPGDYEIQERDGREILFLMNNELLEISLTPTQSNPNALVELRSMARKNKEMTGKNKGNPPAKRAEGEQVPALSDYENAAKYICNAAMDVTGLSSDQQQQCSAAIRVRMDACRDAGATSNEDPPAEDPNMRAIREALSTKELPVATSEEALAVVIALVQNARSGNVSAEAQERATLIQGAIADTRISEGMQTKEYMESLSKFSMTALRAHLKSLKPQLPVGKRNEPVTPRTKDSAEDLWDKPWSELSFVQRGALMKADPVRAKALKEAADKTPKKPTTEKK